MSIIIVNWNTRALLSDCIRSIQRETSISYEVIVIDNFSSDGSVEWLRDKFPDVYVIENNENKGFASANNQGIEIARGNHVLLLNPDTVILENAIDRMVSWLSDKPDVGCVGCQVWETEADIQITCFADPRPINLAIVTFGLMRLADWFPVLGRPWYRNWDRCSERDVDVVSGMFMLVPRPVLECVGPLDSSFFVYAEEADWCRRIRKAGWRCVFTPEARILHLDGGSKSTAQIKSRMYVQMQKSHLIYARKHDGRFGHALVKALFILSAFLRFGLFGLLRLVRSDETTLARVRLSGAALRYHIARQEPIS
ncbi:glycosyltransferase family 2 protein [Kordiimonas sp.]|uniref:glycosyltransferase family 2 protein n=1 Tax=Kordiimonas sp. TaxID=1970157 RepID=UPI003A8D9291